MCPASEAVHIQDWGWVGLWKEGDREVKGHRELRSTSAVAFLLKTNNSSCLHMPIMAILDPFLFYLPTDAGTLAHHLPP